MRSLLELLVDRILAGQPATVYVLDPPCRFPDYSPSYAYMLGCRCIRCRTAKAEAMVAQRRNMRRRRQIIARGRT